MVLVFAGESHKDDEITRLCAELAAVTAERDDFAEQLALRSESGMAKDMQEIMRINNELVAERDALAARLAPVEDKALVEIGIGEIERGNERQWHFAPIEAKNDLYNRMRAAIAATRPHIEAAERERCAKIADSSMLPCDIGGDLILDRYTADTIAEAIRSGK